VPVIMPPPPGPLGWTPIARTNPAGISEMDGWSPGWTGYTFATQIGSSKILTAGFGPGKQTRVLIAADCVFDSLYIGPATTTPFVASQLFRLSFGGQQSSILINSAYSDGGAGMPYTRYSDPLVQGITAPNGLIICGHVLTAAPTGETSAWLTTKGQEPDWSSRYINGDHAADLDKSKLANPATHQAGWYPGGVADFAVLMVEGLY
jgi:hypothetical protein